MRVRGLKCSSYIANRLTLPVAPHAGAWIEMHLIREAEERLKVAPHAGAWIEIAFVGALNPICSSRTPCGCVD